jgi:hypothetical protein
MPSSTSNLRNWQQTWPQLTVSSFLSQANWQGDPVSVANPELSLPQVKAAATSIKVEPEIESVPTPNPVAPKLTGDWQQLSVEQFFNRSNWQGFEQAPSLVSTLERVPEWQPTLTTMVAEFFGRLPWEAQPMIAPQPEPEIQEMTTNPARELTLSDLSDLF